MCVERLWIPPGVALVLDPLPHRQVVDVGWFVVGGSRLDPAGQSGLSHYVEHAVFRGAGERTGRQINREVDARGGTLNGFTDKELTWFECEVLSEHVDFAIEVTADLVLRPTFPPELCRRERDVVLSEAQSAMDDGEERVHEYLEASLWPRSPYARPVVGLVEEVERLEVSALGAHHARTYLPQRMVVVVSGGFDPPKVKERFTHRLRHVEALRPAAQPPPSAPGLVSRRVVPEDLSQVHVGVAVPAVPRGHPDEWALRLLAEILGGGPSSRLFERLREDHGLCYTVYAGLLAYQDRGALTAYLATSADEVSRASRLLAQELVRMAVHGPTEEEVRRAQAAVRGSWTVAAEVPSARMRHLGEEQALGQGARDPARWLDPVLAVTRDQVAEVARRHFLPGAARWHWTALGPVERSWRPPVPSLVA
jgi:predicted Zn-dependent peptidase